MAEKAKSPAGYSRAFDSAPSLAALSEAAIQLWRDRASGAKSPKLLDEALCVCLRFPVVWIFKPTTVEKSLINQSRALVLHRPSDLGASCSKARI